MATNEGDRVGSDRTGRGGRAFRKLFAGAFSDRRLLDVSPRAHLAFLWVVGDVSHPLPGVVSGISPARLGRLLRVASIDVWAILDELVGAGLLLLDRDADIAFAPRAFEYHRPQNPRQLRYWTSTASSLPEGETRDRILNEIRGLGGRGVVTGEDSAVDSGGDSGGVSGNSPLALALSLDLVGLEKRDGCERAPARGDTTRPRRAATRPKAPREPTAGGAVLDAWRVAYREALGRDYLADLPRDAATAKQLAGLFGLERLVAAWPAFFADPWVAARSPTLGLFRTQAARWVNATTPAEADAATPALGVGRGDREALGAWLARAAPRLRRFGGIQCATLAEFDSLDPATAGDVVREYELEARAPERLAPEGGAPGAPGGRHGAIGG